MHSLTELIMMYGELQCKEDDLCRCVMPWTHLATLLVTAKLILSAYIESIKHLTAGCFSP